jgi:hypothetical protein
METLVDDTGNPLVGTWHLVRWDISYGDGRAPSLPFGASATGMILYTHDGSMSTCIAQAGRATLSSDSVRSAPVDERLAAFESFFQYAGRYRIQRQDGRLQVVHSVTQSLNPNFVGTEQTRWIDWPAQDQLALSASDTVPGTAVARHHRLLWQRGPQP